MIFLKGDLLKGVHVKKEIFFKTESWWKDDLSLVFMKFA